MVKDYGLPAWFPAVFTGGQGYSRGFLEVFTPMLGEALSEAYKARPQVFEDMHEALGDEASRYGYNPAVMSYLKPIAAAEGKTPVELMFGFEPGREGLAVTGSLLCLGGILLLKDEPLEHLQVFADYHASRKHSFGALDWEDVWSQAVRRKSSEDAFTAWTSWHTNFEHTALAIREGYRGSRLAALIAYKNMAVKLAVQGVPFDYSVSLLARVSENDHFAGFRAHDFVLLCWREGIAPEYADLVL